MVLGALVTLWFEVSTNTMFRVGSVSRKPLHKQRLCERGILSNELAQEVQEKSLLVIHSAFPSWLVTHGNVLDVQKGSLPQDYLIDAALQLFD
jgi:hypothetical protein